MVLNQSLGHGQVTKAEETDAESRLDDDNANEEGRFLDRLNLLVLDEVELFFAEKVTKLVLKN